MAGSTSSITSYPPISDEEEMHYDFEIDKENLQPLVHGRNLLMLSSLACSRSIAFSSNSEALLPFEDTEEISNEVSEPTFSFQRSNLPESLLFILMQYLSISPDCPNVEVTDSLLELAQSFPNIPIPLTKDALVLLFNLYQDLYSTSNSVEDRDALCIWLEYAFTNVLRIYLIFLNHPLTMYYRHIELAEQERSSLDLAFQALLCFALDYFVPDQLEFYRRNPRIFDFFLKFV